MRKQDAHIISAIDIGTHTVKAAIAEISEETGINIVGKGSYPSIGMKNGEIVNALELARCVDKACKQAESMAGENYSIREAFVSISGPKIQGTVSKGSVILGHREPGQVTDRHVDMIKRISYETVIDLNAEVLEIFAYEFEMDNNKNITQPIGLMGRKLVGHCFIVYIDDLTIRNLERLMEGMEIKRKILKPIITPLADGDVVLRDDEKEQGVAIVNIGHGTSDIGVYRNGYLRFLSVLPYAGEKITQDIITALHIPPDEAQRLKEEYGVYLPDRVDRRIQADVIQAKKYGRMESDKLPRDIFNQVVLARLEEILALIKEDLVKGSMFMGFTEQEVDDYLRMALPAGIVFTGGTANMNGFIDVAEKVMGLPVRVGYPINAVGGMALDKPHDSTLVGLLHRGFYMEILGDDYIKGYGQLSLTDKIMDFISGFFR